jgi:GntR family transcriptional regulator
MLGVSRGTLRSALQRLEESGEIVRRQGSGTFVGRIAMPTAFDERLEVLEPYSSVAARRGLELSCVDLKIEHRAVGGEAGEALGLAPKANATAIWRTLLAGGSPVAVMFDVVHPKIAIDLDALRASLKQGHMVLDMLIEMGVQVTYARTRVMPAVLTARERVGKLLGVRGTTAGLEMEELIFAGRDERVAYSRDLFAPGGIEVMVMRSLESPSPAPIAGRRGARAGGASSAGGAGGAGSNGRAGGRPRGAARRAER